MFIAPILFDVVYHTHSRLSIEYPLNVTNQLKGTLDYYLHAGGNFLVVEAKRADLDRGFNQLAVELIALRISPVLASGVPLLGSNHPCC